MYGGHYPKLTPEGAFALPPKTFVDRAGRTVDVCVYGDGPRADEFEALVELYLAFDPADRTLGIPPARRDRIVEWLERLLVGHCVVAWHGDRAVGQAVLVHDGEGRHELAIFVLRDYQSAGIGRQLLQGVLSYGKQQGVTDVWLLVEAGNRPAVNLYIDVGFVVDGRYGTDLEMSLTLAPHD